jgi:hypothetical protein
MRELAKRNLPYRREQLPRREVLKIFADRDEPLRCELGEIVACLDFAFHLYRVFGFERETSSRR